MKYRSHFQVAKLVEFLSSQVESLYCREVDFKSISSHFRLKSSQLSWYKRLPGLRSCQACRWNRDTGSHHSRSQKPALASDEATHTIQSMRAYAPSMHRSQSCLPIAGMMTCSHRRSTRSWKNNTKPHNWSSGLMSKVSHTLDRRLGTLFHPISRNSQTLIFK